jgi:hypothetical protein
MAEEAVRIGHCIDPHGYYLLAASRAQSAHTIANEIKLPVLRTTPYREKMLIGWVMSEYRVTQFGPNLIAGLTNTWPDRYRDAIASGTE